MKKKNNTSNWSKAGKIIGQVGKTLILIVPLAITAISKMKSK
jgi:hypothetical protein